MVSHLPYEIIFGEILPLVPAKSLVRFKRVCKLWCDTISDPQFVHAHLNRMKSKPLSGILTRSLINKGDYSFLDPQRDEKFDLCLKNCLGEEDGFLYLKASCDGLLLVHAERIMECRYERNYYICNPITRRFLKLPIPPSQWFGASGLAYDVRSRCYKVVGWFGTGGEGCKCMMFTLREDMINICDESFESLKSWKELSLPRGCKLQRFTSPASVKGGLYWVAFNHEYNEHCIISMDITREVFLEIKLPRYEPINRVFTLVGFEGSLYLAQSSSVHNTYNLGSTFLWVLEDLDKDNVWTKLCYFECNGGGGDHGSEIHKFVSNYDTKLLQEIWLMVIKKDRETYMISYSDTHLNSLVTWDA
ncbi:F-box protein At3g08750-like [Macadamia integrifolia]|uniref:F-box protein At3g08750-like n=1 Tax=Macadamia integrifolia TaxID=60698 RepID=UPI001C4E396B|nr:F-box protein At3g08750-like [Macadamia integrifolia]